MSDKRCGHIVQPPEAQLKSQGKYFSQGEGPDLDQLDDAWISRSMQCICKGRAHRAGLWESDLPFSLPPAFFLCSAAVTAASTQASAPGPKALAATSRGALVYDLKGSGKWKVNGSCSLFFSFSSSFFK